MLLTEARKGTGVEELKREIENHRDYLRQNDRLRQRRRQRLKGHVVDLIRARASERLKQRVDENRWDAILLELEERRITPHQAADRLWKEAWPGEATPGS